MNLFENTTEDDFKTGPHFIPKHNGLSEEEQKRLEELRRNYIARKIAEAKNK